MGAQRMTQVALKSMLNFDEKNILTILHNIQGTKCRDPRDRLYAVLGIVEDIEDIEINYSISVQQVYRNWAEKRIRRTRTLDILSACSDSSRSSDLPSWVPDLRRPFGQDKPLWIFTHIAGDKSPPGWIQYPPPRESEHLNFSSDGLALTVKGCQITKIDRLSSVGDMISGLQDPTDLEPRLRSITLNWESMWDIEPTRYFGNQRPRAEDRYGDDFFRELLLRDFGTLSSSTFETASDMNWMYRLWRKRWPNSTQLWYGPIFQSERMKDFGSFLFPRIHGCQLFVTSEGSGDAVAGDAQAQVGDEIWILTGGLTPFILRRVSKMQHLLISPCYLHEYMGCIAGRRPDSSVMEKVILV